MSNKTLLLPLLDKLDMCATIAYETYDPINEKGHVINEKGKLIKDLFGTDDPKCTWEQIKEMYDSRLVEIVSHAQTHPDLVTGDYDPMYQLNGSEAALKDHLGKDSDIIVYPYGSYNIDVISKCQGEYHMGVTVKPGINYPGGDPMQVFRIPMVHKRYTGSSLEREINRLSK